MKRKITVLLAVLACLALTGCGCEHDWGKATCTEGPVCTLCGEAQPEGEALGHRWQDADCLTPETCRTCGATQGSLGDHNWRAASCLAPQTCKTCKLTQGEKVDHVWQEATCTAARSCKVCKLKDGSALGHDWQGECTQRRQCSRCSKKESKALGHNYVDFVCTQCGRDQVSTLEDLTTYLNKHYNTLETAVAKVTDITYQVKDHTGDLFAECDFELQILSMLYSKEAKYSLDYIINYGNMLPYEDRIRAAVQVFDYEMELARLIERFFPGKKVAIYFHQSGYEYPSIQVGYNSRSMLPFQNYKDNHSGIRGYGSTDLCDWYMDEIGYDCWLHSGYFSDSADKLYDDILAACDYDLTFTYYTPTAQQRAKDLGFLP